MNVSSRTPEGQPNHCPLCGKLVRVSPSHPTHDAPCPHCGQLLFFVRDQEDTSSAYFFSPEYEADNIPPHIFSLMPISVGLETGAVPVDKIADLLVVASISPLSTETLDKLRFILQCHVFNVLLSSQTLESLRRLHQQAYQGPES